MSRFSLIPTEKKFFVLFEQSIQNVIRIAQQLKDMVCIWENLKERVGVITDLEHQGDAITHQIIAELHRTFVTPFDREDIALLAHSLDDIADLVHAAADAMLLYKVDQPTERARQLAEILVQAVTEVEKGIAEMRAHIDRNKLLRRCVEINRLENVGDNIYRAAMAELFADSANTTDVIKWREIYEHMETATD
ncbi:MAG: DUF47 domain-containing protein, partial [Chloroflexi bacterium]|nr:DUF47 domain-containing protein [Chloroflexota bacterium]